MTRVPARRSEAERGLRWALLALLVGAGLPGCRIVGRDEVDPPEEEEQELSQAESAIVEDSGELDGAAQDGSALAAIPTLPLLLGGGARTLAAAVEAQQVGAALFVPQGCATATADGNVVTYTFDGCTGSYGLVEIRGRQVSTFRPGPEEGSIAVEVRSDGLTLNDRPVEHSADVVVTPGDETVKRIDWSGSFVGTGPRGGPVEHTANITYLVDEATRCATLDGLTSGRVGLRGLDVRYVGLEVCAPRGTCPAGRIEATAALRDVSVAIEFDGSATATVETPRGVEVDVDLACAPRAVGP